MNRRGDASAAPYEIDGGEAVDGHDGRASQEAAELYGVADASTGHGDDADGGRLVIHHADCHLVGDDGRDSFG